MAQGPESPDGIWKTLFELIAAGCGVLCTFLCGTLGFGLVTFVSQTILSNTVVSWQHVTLIPEGPQYGMQVDATIKIPGVFGAVLDPYAATLSTMTPVSAGNSVKTVIGKANAPQMSLKP